MQKYTDILNYVAWNSIYLKSLIMEIVYSLVFLNILILYHCVLERHFFLSFIQSSTTLWEFLTSPWEPIFPSCSSASLCESEWLFSCIHSPIAWLVAHSKPLDPPHYKQQITVLTENTLWWLCLQTVKMFCLDKHTCQSSVLGYESVMGLWYHGPLRPQTTACLLHFTCAEQNTWHSVFSHCSDRQENLWVFVLPKVSLSAWSQQQSYFFLDRHMLCI